MPQTSSNEENFSTQLDKILVRMKFVSKHFLHSGSLNYYCEPT